MWILSDLKSLEVWFRHGRFGLEVHQSTEYSQREDELTSICETLALLVGHADRSIQLFALARPSLFNIGLGGFSLETNTVEEKTQTSSQDQDDR